MVEQYEKYKSVHSKFDKMKPKKQEQFREQHSAELALFEAAAKYLDKLKSSGEAVTPKRWRSEVTELNTRKELWYQEMRTMRDDLKAAESLKRTAEQLSKTEQSLNREDEVR